MSVLSNESRPRFSGNRFGLKRSRRRSPTTHRVRFEPLEDRQLLSAVPDAGVGYALGSDVRIFEAAADGYDTLIIDYEITGSAVIPFGVGFYRSADTVFDGGDELLDSVMIDSDPDRNPGRHVLTFPIGGGTGQVALPGAGAAETDDDYFIIAVADHLDTVVENDSHPFGEDNTTRFEGIYHVSGGNVLVQGTAGADVLSAKPGSLRLVADGETIVYTGSDVTGLRVRGHEGLDNFEFDYGGGFGSPGTFGVMVLGGEGQDYVVLVGSYQNDTASVYPNSAVISGPGFEVSVSDATEISVFGGGDNDTVSLFDSPGDDTFAGSPFGGILSGPGYDNQAGFFKNVLAYATAGGNDSATLNDSSGNDKLKAAPDYAKIYNSQYFVRAKSFDVVQAYAKAGGNDSARLFDSSANDKLKADPTYAKMYGSGYFVRAKLFDEVTAYASGGYDLARLYDSASNDKFIGSPAKARMYGNVTPFDVTARRFDDVWAYSNGGVDKARLFDSPGDEEFRGRANKTTFEGPGFDFTLRTFEEVYAWADQGGNDVAKLHDTDAADHLEAVGNWAELSVNGTPQNLLYQVTDFARVKAYRTTGFDTADVASAANPPELIGGWVTPASAASGVTDSTGKVTLALDGRTLEFRLIDETTQDPISGLNVALSLDNQTSSFGVITIGDSSGQFPLQTAFVSGPLESAPSGYGGDTSAPSRPKSPAANLDPAEDDVPTLGVKKGLDGIVESVLTDAIEGFSETTANAVGFAKTVSDLGSLAVKTLCLSVGEPNSPLVKEEVFTSKQTVVDRVNQELNEKNVSGMVVIAGVSLLGNPPAGAGALLGFGLNVADWGVDRYAISRVGEGESVVRREYDTPFGRIATYASGGFPFAPAGPFADFAFRGQDAYGNPLPRSSSVELVSKDNFGASFSVPLDTAGEATVAVPVGNYKATIRSPGFEGMTTDVGVPVGGYSWTQTLGSGGPVPAVSIDDTSVPEADSGSTTAIFLVTLSETSSKDVTFTYATANGSALAGSDYTSISGQKTIPAGSLGTTISVPVTGDQNDESDETFYVNLSGVSGATVADSQGIATIVDNDGVSRFDGSYTGSYNGTATVPGFGSFPANGPVAFTVANGVLNVTVPDAGSGTVASSGDASFGAAGGSVGDASFSGTFVVGSSGVATASGSWFSNLGGGGTASGGWIATRSALQLADGYAAASASQESTQLLQEALEPTVAEAAVRWAAAGADDVALRTLSRLDFQIVDLPGSTLGSASKDTIYLDPDAAGRGWFVDSTPEDDEEFPPSGQHGSPITDANSTATRVDLLTVVMHELGHVLGLDDLDPPADSDSLMTATLSPGIRRLPTAALVDAIFSDGIHS